MDLPEFPEDIAANSKPMWITRFDWCGLSIRKAMAAQKGSYVLYFESMRLGPTMLKQFVSKIQKFSAFYCNLIKT